MAFYGGWLGKSGLYLLAGMAQNLLLSSESLNPIFLFVTKKGGVVRQLILLLSLSGIGTIFYAIMKVISLNRKIPGGIVKESWRLLYYLVGLMGVGYLTMPILSNLPETSRELIIAIIFLAGAVFILKVINLLNKIIRDIGL
jgi:hypothetical protein